jgi:carboxymethylenebutenolidase
MKNRLTAKDFDQRILELYDHYAHGKITKREFLKILENIQQLE